jgi:hypothetical protein
MLCIRAEGFDRCDYSASPPYPLSGTDSMPRGHKLQLAKILEANKALRWQELRSSLPFTCSFALFQYVAGHAEVQASAEAHLEHDPVETMEPVSEPAATAPRASSG